MGCIKSLELHNFQSHKNSSITFHDKLTVILGQTDQGKSAIIRALKWVLYNEPRGTDFITAGCNTCKVSLKMSDGTVITRERDRNKNRYILIRGGEKQVFEGFGHNVPLEITRAHGIPKIFIDRDSNAAVNLAEQLEPPFLISESGSKRAKALGRLVGVHIIDAAQRITIKDLNDTEQRRKLLNKEIESIKKELENFTDLDEKEKRVSRLKSLLIELKQKMMKVSKLREINQKLIPTLAGIEESENLIKKTGFFIKAEQNIAEANLLISKYLRLLNISKRMKHIEQTTKVESSHLKKTSSISQIDDIFLKVAQVNSKHKKLTYIKDNLEHIKKWMKKSESYLEATQMVDMAEKAVAEVMKLFETLIKYKKIKDKLTLIDNGIRVQERELAKLRSVVSAQDILDKITEKSLRLSVLTRLKKAIFDNEKSLLKGKEYLKQVYCSINSMTHEYCVLLKKLSRCPTCLNLIDDETADRIVHDILNRGKYKLEGN